MRNSKATKQSQLVLGWKVTSTGELEYWRNRNAKPGAREQEKHLFKVPAGRMGAHTAIIAQSGSGKSFFLGRLIEELMLRTRCNCLILDPNADFKQISTIEDKNLWKTARYDSLSRRGKLPHESSQREFKEQWSKVTIRIGVHRDFLKPIKNYERLKFQWPKLSVDFLGEDLEPRLRSDLYHCHALVQSLETLYTHSRKVTGSYDLLTEAEELFKFARKDPYDEEALRLQLQQQFLTKNEIADASRTDFTSFTGLRLTVLYANIEAILAAIKYISHDVQRFYFGKANEYVASGIVDVTKTSTLRPKAKRLQVIDLPSLRDTSTRLLVINALLNTLWDEARTKWSDALENPENEDTRVPTFVVVDEAHNLIPADTHSRAEIALRNQFRTIIAEGRKYGLFLILVSQRPDKLDPLIVSECENKAIMRLASESVLELTQKMLGLEDVPRRLLNRVLEYEIGSVLLLGRWAQGGPQRMYCAARRTKEGGRNLREKHWATSPVKQRAKPTATAKTSTHDP